MVRGLVRGAAGVLRDLRRVGAPGARRGGVERDQPHAVAADAAAVLREREPLGVEHVGGDARAAGRAAAASCRSSAACRAAGGSGCAVAAAAAGERERAPRAASARIGAGRDRTPAGILGRPRTGERARLPEMRVGILTAGGDCPGLNAVIRAAARRLLAARPRADRPAPRLPRPRRARPHAARPEGRLGDPAARRHDPLDLELQPVPRAGRAREGARRAGRRPARRGDRDRRRAHDDDHAPPVRGAGPAGDRRAEDDRQRRRRHRLHVRLRHRRADRHRRRSTACTRPRSRTTA